MTKKTYRRIRKAVMFARGLFLTMCGALVLLCAISADCANLLIPIAFCGAAIVCFAIALFCDILLGGYKSPFYY